jgi:small redox-active disulfide protein 2
MEIKVLGTGCASCKALFSTTEQAVKELNLDAQVVKEEDMLKIMEYNVLSLPALVVDGKVVAKGKKLSVDEVKNLLTNIRQ